MLCRQFRRNYLADYQDQFLDGSDKEVKCDHHEQDGEPGCAVHVSDSDNSPIPTHLEDLFTRACENLNSEQQALLRELLIEFQDVFARSEFDLGNFTAIEHCIETGDAKPIKQRIRRTPMSFVDEEKAHLQKMLDAGVIQPSSSSWSSAPVLVRKRDGGVRWCLDYRALNKVTTKDVYPLPLVEDCIDMLSGHTWFSKLDANSAYWQIRINEPDQKKTAFSTKFGLYEFMRMSFGLCNAPATFFTCNEPCVAWFDMECSAGVPG